MLKKTLCAAVLAATLMTTGCNSGPKRFTRTWDDYVNQKYSESAWIHGAVLQDIVPVYPIVGLFAALGDGIYNLYYFWAIDAWDGKGTSFTHKAVEGSDKLVAGCSD